MKSSSSDVVSAGRVADRGDDDILSTMRRRMEMAISAYSESREDELDDLRFYGATPDNQWQWPTDVLATRAAVQGQTINARPTLTINKLPQHVHQVTNDQRQNRPTGKVIPVDDNADVEVAEIFNGIIRHIQYISDADVAYDTACENQVVFGEGYIRLITEYSDPESFDQDIKIMRVRNSFSVYMDPLIQDPTGADARWCFITEDTPKDEYERLYPEASPVSTLENLGVGDQGFSQWIGQDTIRIVEYFYIESENKTLNLYANNQAVLSDSKEDKELKSIYGKPVRTRKSETKHIMWVKSNGYEILDKREWPGDRIPIIRIPGNEFEVEGRLYLSGIIRNAKDAQRMYNYWVSQEAEMLALAPKAPFVGYGGQFEGYETAWKTANTINNPYLEVNPDVTDGNGTVLPLPQRAMPPLAQNGLIQAKIGAADDIKSATGQYNASLGQTSNEKSGKAIIARQKESDVGTYHYRDNLSRGIRSLVRQIVLLITKLFDTQRIARIIGEDGKVDMVKIDPDQKESIRKIYNKEGVVIEKIYNLGVGKYDVVAETGPGYATKRQEALEAMAQLLQGNPDLWKVAGDLFVKNMDWPGAQEMAKRFKKIIDPNLFSENEDSPELQMANQQIQQMGQEMEQMRMMLQNFGKSLEVQEQKRKDFEAQIKAYDAETKRISVMQSDMSHEQIQDIAMGTIDAVLDTGAL